MFCITIEHKSSCNTKIFHHTCKILFGEIHPKCLYQLVENFHIYLHEKNKLHQCFFLLRYCKNITNFSFRVLWTCAANLMFICMQKMNSISNFLFLRYCKVLQTCYTLWYFDILWYKDIANLFYFEYFANTW